MLGFSHAEETTLTAYAVGAMPPSGVTSESAVLRGEVEIFEFYYSDGELVGVGEDIFLENPYNVEVWFAFDDNDSTPSCSSSSQKESVLSLHYEIIDDEELQFWKVVDNLNEDEKYYFRACAGDEGDLFSGSVKSFTTDESDDERNEELQDQIEDLLEQIENLKEVEISTNSADDVDEDSAVLVGEVDEGDNVEVWFAFDDNDSTPSCSSSSQKESVSGRYDDGDEFEEKVSGLDEDEKYYFRACAEDEDGDIVSGSVRSFTTDDDDDDNSEEIEELKELLFKLIQRLEYLLSR